MEGDSIMGFTPAIDGSEIVQPVLDRGKAVGMLSAKRTTLRFGGLTMDSATGAVSWRGRSVTLPTRERELLAALLKRAGQIVSCDRLAAMVGVSTRAVDEGIDTLRAMLKQDGISTVPTKVDGCGYVLWRS